MGMVNGHYDGRDLLGYGAKWNLIFSHRGPGKTWWIKHHLMRQDGTFMCVYRQKPDMHHSIKDWPAQLISSKTYNRELFSFEGSDEDGYQMLYRNVVKGYFRTLTSVNNIKQEFFPDNLNWGFWDEFVPLCFKKLPGISSEGDALRTIDKTIDHDASSTREERGLKPLRWLLVGNPHTANNPIINYFHVNLLKGPGIFRAGPGVVWELLDIPTKPRTGKMTTDEFLGDEVNLANGFTFQDAFICDIPKGCHPSLSVRFGRDFYLIFRGGSQTGTGNYYIQKRADHLRTVPMWGTLDGMQIGEQCIDGSFLPNLLRRAAYNGRTFYTELNTKFEWLNAIQEI